MVGGLVDRSVVKGASLGRAGEIGVRDRRLPLGGLVGWKRCLNVDVVVRLLLEY